SKRRVTAPERTTRGAAPTLAPYSLRPSTIYRFVMGVDPPPAVMPAGAGERLAPPLRTLLRRGPVPPTARPAVGAPQRAGVLPQQASYLVSEAGQIAPDVHLERDMRFVVTRGTSTAVDLLVSTSAVGDPAEVFLQIAAWDGAAGLFNYYMRLDRTWVWAG